MSVKTWGIAIAGVVLTGAVGVTAVTAVSLHREYSELDHGEPFELTAGPPLLDPAGTPEQVEDVDTAALATRLGELAQDPALGTFHGVVTDTTTGEVVWDNAPDEALVPASATKILTSAAAILALDADHRLTTRVVAGEQPGEVIIVTGGDVWLNGEDLAALAEQITAHVPEVTRVGIDASAWTGTDYVDSWDPTNIDGGYVAPLQPAMINGGRLTAPAGDVPRSHTPALDVAAALAERVGAEGSGEDTADPQAEVIAEIQSDPLTARTEDMMQHSDNVMAEAIGREVAIATQTGTSVEDAVAATLNTLTEAGIDVTGVHLEDNSGLSDNNRIPPRVLNDILTAAVTGTELRPLLDTLPVAHGEGTLEDRYADLPGRGYVRAKTGTLTGTNALAGTVIADSGRIYAFALLSNDADILSGRQALDRFASAIRED
ncbi:D-alanyl-D-alanine carboxypeptidase/D-alanyl-D-alanine-endopeptidase [Corynebacterium yudongzhengii]|uniref:D-alanyl-D-alanine carboxypeptidase/D-alanyl-D-alanine-endopeptidase n=1 Tax=Corynebacterium yudongzhengii TaxID=2080740 RepID=A0A2U1T5Y6_9CORY|nr:D-alanyl-D-alanine carboxypeptidase/D-alanyl-D-alanine-endopeptidase [Corynebacterium yudongzhengii]AWB82650.1 D-alanyl-D-alanine carboxypeptidase/D-alanyl-D-alanine-endopeptidase [Corynebacterium yudongzhengii]PWC01385.1 D-alanyl-D-alanine carboxypeptidase/D-alanyl-D-alanine-endopeptidase [Corynebacterium yudongzhengii]